MYRLALAVLLPAVLGGCVPTQLPDVLSARNPVDEGFEIRRSADPAIIGDYNHREPTNPKAWRQLNDGQSPAGGGAS